MESPVQEGFKLEAAWSTGHEPCPEILTAIANALRGLSPPLQALMLLCPFPGMTGDVHFDSEALAVIPTGASDGPVPHRVTESNH